MSKRLLSAALAAVLGLAAFAPQAARAADGTITFNGKVLSSTCTVSNASGGVVTVTLPDVPKSAFSAQGDVAGLTPFSLNLAGCPTTPSGVVVGATFAGNSNIDASTGAIQNPTTAGYSNVEVQLTNPAGTTAYNLNSTPNPVTTAINGSGNATLSYAARYYQGSSTAVSAGTVNTSVTFLLTYN